VKNIPLLISSLLNRLTGNEHATMAVLAVVVGTIGGFGAIAFRLLIDLVQTLAYGAKGNLLELALASPWYVKLIVPSVGGLFVGPLVYFLAREAKGHGVPEVMEAIALRQGIIRKRVVFIKCIVSAGKVRLFR
jgi:CIC family chloride channel protein